MHQIKSTPLFFIFFFIANINISSQNTIASWNFNNLTKNPQTGSGTLSTIGGIVDDWTKTGINPDISLPEGILEVEGHKTGIGLQTFNYPLQGQNAKTAGIQVNVSTVGFKNILFRVDVRQGGTSANKLMLQYTTDGITWEKAVTYTTDNNDTWYLRNYNFSNISAVNNNPNFAIRMVTNFDDDIPDLTIYVPVKLTNDYVPSGAIRWDNVIVKGDEISKPEDTRGSISEWTFDNLNLLTSNGSGTLTLIGGVSADWTKTGIIPNQTIVGEGIYDVAAVKIGAGLQTLNYPTLGNANKTSGIQLNVSTLGYKDVIVSADVRHGGTSANNMIIQYTVDGSQWIDGQNFIVNSGDTWYKKFYDFSAFSTVNENPNFAVRFVTAFQGLTYMPTGFGKEYKTTGPVRFDNVTVKGRLVAGFENIKSTGWKYTNSKLIFDQMPDDKIIIYDLSGRIVLIHETATEISLENLSKGIYLFSTKSLRGKFIR